MKGVISWTQRKCKDCDFQPALCQVQGRDCHMNWHKSSFDEKRNSWFQNHQKSDLPQQPMATYYTRSQATQQKIVREQDVSRGGQDESETHREQDEGETHREQDEGETHREQDEGEIHREQNEGETHGEQDVSCGGQDEIETHEEQGSSQELQTVTAHTSDQPQDTLLLRPRNPATRHSARRGRPKGSINKRRRRGCYKIRMYS